MAGQEWTVLARVWYLSMICRKNIDQLVYVTMMFFV